MAARVFAFLVCAVLLLAAGAGGWLYWRLKRSLPQSEGAVTVAGLHAPVEVLRDEHGVPHIRAQSLDDLLFAQGYVTAQDRLFQMDLSRRFARGELSEILGESTLPLDIENRTLGFPELMEQAAGELDPTSKKLMDAYAAGVNAFIDSHRGRLPIEFLLLRYDPTPWRGADCFGIALNMSKVLNNTWRDDLMREKIRTRISPELYADLFPDRSDLDHPVAELTGLDTEHTEVSRGPERNQSELLSVPTLTPFSGLSVQSLHSPEFAALNESANLGSNNWVIGGAHTRSGKPLLANDPHLAHSLPSVWYMIHLEAPGLDVSGVSFPGLPLVIIGHNRHIAWGVTNTGPDVQDLYSETFNIKDKNKYLHNNEWVDARVRQETIHVRHANDYKFQVRVTRHGPVISHDGNRDLALQWTALEPGALKFAFLKIAQASNWQEFTEALHDFTGPMQNFVYADEDGNIGYYAAGWVPIRKKGDGTIPVPGSTDEYDWNGYIPFGDLPHAYNPASGIIATANGRVVPDGYPYLITHHWASPFRTARIFNLLNEGKQFTVPGVDFAGRHAVGAC